jgi:hypothetical protein
MEESPMNTRIRHPIAAFVVALLIAPSSTLGQRLAQPAQPVTAAKAARSGVLAGTKRVKYVPNRAEALRSQITLRDAENAIAQNARKVAVSAVNPGPAPSPRAVAVPASAMSKSVTRPRVDAPAVTTPPGVWFVNNRERNFTLTPGGYVTIVGKGFGDGVGKASIFVPVNGGTLELPFRVIDWHDREIYALLPAGIRGVTDGPARLQVTTRPGTAYSLDAGKFVAAREEITVNVGLSHVIQLAPSPKWNATMGDDGRVDRVQDQACASGGTDRLYFKPQANGFVVSGVGWWTGREDTGDGDGRGNEGSRSFAPGYSFGDWSTGSIAVGRDRSAQVPTLTLNWGAWCSRSENSNNSPYSNATFSGFESTSNYQVEVSLIGPAGLRPF